MSAPGAARIDLVADLGEAYGPWQMGDDEALLAVISSANVACGFHAGDPRTMDASVRRCVERGVGIGCHPGYPDRVGFGRRPMALTPDEIRTDVLYQLGALSAFAAVHGARVEHITPHGSLNNRTVVSREAADAVASAVADFDPSLRVYAQEGCMADAARARGLPLVLVGFADRAYEPDGTLRSRALPGAVLHDEDEVVARALRMAVHGEIVTTDGSVLATRVDALLLHGDNPGSVAIARAVRTALEDAGVVVTRPLPATP